MGSEMCIRDSDYINVGQLTTNNYLSENLGEGDHSIIVKAIDANWNYFWESEPLVVNLSNSSNGGNTSTPTTPQNDDPNPIGTRTNPEPADNDRGKIDPSSWSYPEVYQKPGYQLSFSDEFDNSVLSQERWNTQLRCCLLYTSPSPRDLSTSRMPSSA